MNEFTKRLLSFATAAVMVFSMIPNVGFAADNDQGAEPQAQSDISSLPADAQTAITNAAEINEYAKENLRFTDSADHPGYCPVCKKDVTWKPVTAAGALGFTDGNYSGHHYLANDITGQIKSTWVSNNTQDNVDKGTTVADLNPTICLNLNGNDVTNTATALSFTHGGTFNILDSYAGTENASVVKGDATSYWTGAAIIMAYSTATSAGTVVQAETTVNLYGGIFKKGVTSGTDDGTEPGEVVVFMNDKPATLNLYAGAKIDGTDGAFRTDTYAAVVSMIGNAHSNTFNMYGGEIIGSDFVGSTNARTGGRAVYVKAPGTGIENAFNMYGGTITGGTLASGYNGGSVYIDKGATMTMYGGKISGGKAGATNYDVYVVSGGTLTNNTYVDVIDAVNFADSSYSYSAKCRHCANLAENPVTDPVTWTKYDFATAASQYMSNGHYYLTTDASLTKSFYISGNTCLHLNGKNTTSTTPVIRSFQATNGSLNIMGEGVITGVGTASRGAAISVAGPNSPVNIYGGTYTKASTDTVSPILCIEGTGGYITMHGGTVGDKSLTTGSVSAVYVNAGSDVGTFTLNGGKIYGGSGSNASAVYSAAAKSSFVMNGGSIESNASLYLILANKGDVTIGKDAVLTGTATGAITQWSGNTDTVITISGTVNGKVNTSNTNPGSITVTGTPNINYLNLQSGATIDATGLVTADNGTKPSIVVNSNGAALFTTAFETPEAAAAAAEYFSIYNDDGSKEVFANDDKKLEIGVPVTPGAETTVTQNLDFGTDGKAWCPVCGDYFEWTPLTNGAQNTLQANTHYYVPEGGFSVTNATTGAIKNPTSGSACLHLNGETITNSGSGNCVAIWANNAGTLNVMGTGTVKGSATDYVGSAVYVANASAQVNLYSGTYTKVDSDDSSPIVFINTAGAVTMEENVVIDARNHTFNKLPAIAIYGSSGDAIFTMNGGTVYGSEDYTGNGRIAFVGSTANGKMVLNGGQIIGHSTVSTTADILLNKGDLIVGANAQINSGVGGYAINQWSGNTDTKMTISGTVIGKVASSNTADGCITLSGTPSITKLHAASCKVDATAMTGLKTGSAKILLTASGSKVTFKDADTATAALEWFAYDGTDRILSVSDNTLITSEPQGNETSITEDLDFVGTKAWCPVCKTHGNVWTQVTDDMTISAAGHYYLNSNDITNVTIANNGSAVGKVCLHLNSHNITNSSGTAITVNDACELNVMGTGTVSGTGVIDGTSKIAASIHVGAADNEAVTINLHSGTYDKTGSVATYGIYSNYATLNLIECTVLDNSATATYMIQATGGDINVKSGATVRATATNKYTLNQWGTASSVITVEGTVYGAIQVQGGFVLKGEPNVNFVTYNANSPVWSVDATGLTGGSVTVNIQGTFSTAFGTGDAGKAAAEAAIAHLLPINANYEIVAVETGSGWCLAQQEKKGAVTNIYEALDFPTAGSTNAWCPACGAYKDWTALTAGSNTMANGGHYYLADNLTVSSGTINIINLNTEGVKACVHMNGHNIVGTMADGKSYGPMGISVTGANSTLNIMGTGTISADYRNNWIASTLFVNTTGATVNLRGEVTLTKSANDTLAPIVGLFGGNTINMHEKVTIGDTALTTTSTGTVRFHANSTDATLAGAFNMYGGTINGMSTISNSRYGTAIEWYHEVPMTFNMEGGVINGGPSTRANAYVIYAIPSTGARVNIGEDAKIYGTAAGNVLYHAWAAEGNLFDLTIAGEVYGTVNMTNSNYNAQLALKLAGDAYIQNLVMDGKNTLAKENITLTSGAVIYLNTAANENGGIFTGTFGNEDAAKAYAGYFKPVVDGVYYEGVYSVVVTPANELKVEFTLSHDADIVWVDEDAKTGFCPVCQKVVTWKTPVVDNTNWFDDGFHFYIPDGGLNFTAEKDAFNLNQAGGNETGCLHLNGNNLTAARTALAVINNNIVNVMGTGTISGSGADYWLGSALHTAGADTKINVYGEVTLTKAAGNVVAPIIFNNGGTVNIHDNVVIDGRNRTSTNNSAMISLYNADSTFNMYGGTYYAGTLNVTDVENHSKYNALYAAAGSTFYMQGGTLYAGTAALEGQPHILVNGNNVTIGENALITGSTTGYILNQWDGTGTLTISGHIEGKVQSSQTKDGQFILSGTPEITSLNMAGSNSKVDVSGMTGGNVGLSVAANNLRVFTTEITTGTPATIAGYFTYVGETEEFLVIAAEGNYLAVSKASFVVIDASGNEVPVNTVAAAVEYVTTNPGSYIKVTDTVALTLSGETITLDMNGNTASVSGTGTVIGFDSTTDGFGKTTAGILKAGELVDVKQDVTVNDNRYLYIMHGEGNYSFHRVIIKLTQIVLNTKNSALYYKAQFRSDETLASRVKDFGISYSLYDADKGVGGMPSASNPIASQIDVPMAGEFTGNNAASTSYISDIVTEGSADNATSVEMKICANPFLQVDVTGDDGVQGFGQYSSQDTGKAKSLKDILDYYENESRYNALKNQTFTDDQDNLTNKAEELDKFYKTMFTDNDIDLGYTLIGSTYAAPAATNDEEEEG